MSTPLTQASLSRSRLRLERGQGPETPTLNEPESSDWKVSRKPVGARVSGPYVVYEAYQIHGCTRCRVIEDGIRSRRIAEQIAENGRMAGRMA